MEENEVVEPTTGEVMRVIARKWDELWWIADVFQTGRDEPIYEGNRLFVSEELAIHETKLDFVAWANEEYANLIN